MTQSLTELLARADGIVLRREEAARDHLRAVAVEDAATAALAAARAALAEAEGGHAASVAARASVEGRQAVCRADFDELTGLLGTHGLKPETVEQIVESRLELLRSLGLALAATPTTESVKPAPAPATLVASVVATTMAAAAKAAPTAAVASAHVETPAPVAVPAEIQAAGIPEAPVPAVAPKVSVAEVLEMPPAPEVAPSAADAAPEVLVETLAEADEAETVEDGPVEEQPVEEELPQLALPEPTGAVVAKPVARITPRVAPKAPAAAPSSLTPTTPLVAEQSLAALAPSKPVAVQAPLPTSGDEAEALSWVEEVSAEEDAAQAATAEGPGDDLPHDSDETIADEDGPAQDEDAHGVADGVSQYVHDGFSPSPEGASEAEPLAATAPQAAVAAVTVEVPAPAVETASAAPVILPRLPPKPQRTKKLDNIPPAPERQAAVPSPVVSQDPFHASVVAGLDGDLPAVGHQQPDQSFGEDEAGRPIAASAPAEAAPAPAKPAAAVVPAAIATPAPGAPPMPSFLLNMMAKEQTKSPPAT